MTHNIYSLDTPIPDALTHFKRKHGVIPNVVRVNTESELEADGVKVIRDERVLEGEYWLGVENEA
jgi:hypothetical protein